MSFQIARASMVVVLAAFSASLHAQVIDIPNTITPLRVESDHNGVNVIDGKLSIGVPVLSVPGAPNLRFDRVQNVTPLIKGKIVGVAGDMATADYAVHTGTGSSEGFHCDDLDACYSVTGTGSILQGVGPFWFRHAGSGALYSFNRKHIKETGASPNSVLYYASSIIYPSGETIVYSHDTAEFGGATFHRTTQISSNLGYFITITYQGSQIGVDAWGAVSEATLYASANPTTPLGRLTYGSEADFVTTITDLGGRVYRCQACGNAMGTGMQASSGMVRLPGEGSASLQVTSVPSKSLVASVNKDGVAWNYAYANLRSSGTLSNYLYDRLTVTGPNGYNVLYDMEDIGERNVITQITDSIGRVNVYDFDAAYRVTRIAYPEGNQVSVAYDELGNIISRTAQPKPGSGLAVSTETAFYDPAGCPSVSSGPLCYRPVWFRDARNKQTDFLYNTAGQLTERTDPADADGVRRKTYITYQVSPSGVSRQQVVRVCGDITTCGTTAEIRTEYEYFGNTLLPSVVRRIDAARAETLQTNYTYDSAGRLLSEDGPLAGTGDAKYFRYDTYGRKTWEIGPLGANGFRNARNFAYRDPDDKVTSTEDGTVTDPNSTSLTPSTLTELSYDSHRNPSGEKISASGTSYGLTQRSFDDSGRVTCEARRMNPAVFSSVADACAPGSEGAFGPDRITHNVYNAAGQVLQVQRAYGTSLQQNYATYTYTNNGKLA